MALDKEILKRGLSRIMDTQGGNAYKPTESKPIIAARWADAINDYGQSVTPVSVSGVAARAAAYAILNVPYPTGGFISILQAALTSYATALAAGMLPLYTGVPPVTVCAVIPAFSLPLDTPIQERINSLVTIIDTWFKTGTATLVAPPNTPTTWT